MPFTDRTFANVAGASSAAAGQVVQSAVWDNIHEDYSAALNQLMEQLVSFVSNRNIMWMNGGLEVWQRGAGNTASIAVAASTTAYTADRWYITTQANQACTIDAATGLSNPSTFSGKFQRNAAQTGILPIVIGYPLDTDEIVRMRGNKVSLSLLAKAGADWSPSNGTLFGALYVGTGSVGKRGGGFTNETQVFSFATNLSAGGSATQISVTSSAVVPVNSTQAELQIFWIPVGTAGADDSITIDDVELECNLSSDTWTPCDYDRLPFPVMLEACKRHYQKTYDYNTAPATASQGNALTVMSQGNIRTGLFWQFPVAMRTTPTMQTYNPLSTTASSWQDISTTVSVVASIYATILNTKGLFIAAATVSATDHLLIIQAQADAGI